MQKFATPTPVSTVLDIPAGRIQLIAADRTDTAVEVRPANPAKSRDITAAEQTQVTYTDGVLNIHAGPAQNRFLGPCGSVEITVQLPTGSRINATTADIELRGVGRLGDVSLTSSRATVKLDEAATTHLTLDAGDITLHRLAGPAEITTKQGDIHITEATTGTVTLATLVGHISIGAARTTSATLDAGTTYGRITNTLTNAALTPTLTIHATTAHGNITARTL